MGSNVKYEGTLKNAVYAMCVGEWAWTNTREMINTFTLYKAAMQAEATTSAMPNTE